MRIFRIANISILILFFSLQSAFAFRYQRSRWRLADLPILCYFNVYSIPRNLAVDDIEHAIIQSIATWNQAAEMAIFKYAGRVELDRPLADDGWNAISFVSADWLEVTERLSVNGTIVGTTCTWRLNDPIGSPPRQGFAKNSYLRAFDIAMNAEMHRWSVGAKPIHLDVQSVITHELGHALSLGHPDADARDADAPTMVERMYPNDTKLRSLETDDINGVQTIYRRVSGILRQDARWENEIWIDGQVIVPDGVSVTISPSTPPTIVHFSPGSKLIIEGELIVDASAQQRLLFTGAKKQNGEYWSGLEIRPTAQIQLAHCIFEGAQVALALMSTADVSIQNCEFRHNQIALLVDDSQEISIKGRFHQNRVGMKIQSSRDVKIVETIVNQNDVGAHLIDTDAQIRSSNFTENQIGVKIFSEQPVRIRESSITHNAIGVQVLRGAVDLGRSPDDSGFNNLFSNTVWNIYLGSPSHSPIFAKGNYFLKLTPAEIDGTIRDDDEVSSLPKVLFEPTLSRLRQSALKVEILDVEPYRGSSTEELMDGWTIKSLFVGEWLEPVHGRKFLEATVRDDQGDERVITVATAQTGYTGFNSVLAWHIVHLRAANLQTDQAKPFTIQLYLSYDAEPEPATDILLDSEPTTIQRLNPGEDRVFEIPYLCPDLAIDGISQAFYIWASVLSEDVNTPIIVPGKWITIYEELADLVGIIYEIPAAAVPGEEIDVRYSIQNYGRQQQKSQIVRFYLSKTWNRWSPPKPDYPLAPEIQLPKPAGKWTSQLTIPTDVPLGDYYLWMMVDADNNILERNSKNNPATYLANTIRIEAPEVADESKYQKLDEKHSMDDNPSAVEFSPKPSRWGAQKTALLQNYPNPFNPETWIPFELAEDASVRINIYDVNGNIVRRFHLGQRKAGIYTSRDRALYWDGRDNTGERVSSGIYFYRLQAGSFTAMRKLVIAK